MSGTIHHLPQAINEQANRSHYYESCWKRAGLDLLASHNPSLDGLSLLDDGCGRGETLRLAAEERGMNQLGTPFCWKTFMTRSPNLVNPKTLQVPQHLNHRSAGT